MGYIRVHFFAPYAKHVNRDLVEVAWRANYSVRELLQDLTDMFPGLREELSDDPQENLANFITMIVDGGLARPEDIIADNADVKIFGPTCGG